MEFMNTFDDVPSWQLKAWRQRAIDCGMSLIYEHHPESGWRTVEKAKASDAKGAADTDNGTKRRITGRKADPTHLGQDLSALFRQIGRHRRPTALGLRCGVARCSASHLGVEHQKQADRTRQAAAIVEAGQMGLARSNPQHAWQRFSSQTCTRRQRLQRCRGR